VRHPELEIDGVAIEIQDAMRYLTLHSVKCKIVVFQKEKSMNDRLQWVVGQRIRLARETSGLTQEALSASVGFKDRQTLSTIEAGKRSVAAEELVCFSEVLRRPLEFFTDSFSLAGEAQFSWRIQEVKAEALTEFEEKAGRWIATYRRLSELRGVRTNPLRQRLPIEKHNSFEEAADAGEALASAWHLGDHPADHLREQAERHLGLLTLYVDAPDEISGAAVRLPDFHTILINRKDTTGRRHFDFAHELFHLLTWDTLPPRTEDPDTASGYTDKRTENLANNFAGGLLMPHHSLEACWKAHSDLDINDRLVAVAHEMGVTAQAVRYRVTNLGWIIAQEKESINDVRLTRSVKREGPPPLPFSKAFVERLHWGIDEGRLSARKAAQLLDFSLPELEHLFRAYDMEVPFEL
jgi:Zn-dependent peptidase ImmA (M78 family)/DNA-binding XRE family transcriptional regulator